MALVEILSSFSDATEAARQVIPDSQLFAPSADGITLLDVKNEIYLAYLQALALRNLSVIRSLKEGVSPQDAQAISDEITKKLIEHRVYLERGARPLEQKIKYQVDKVIKAAEDEERGLSQKAQAASFKPQKGGSSGKVASTEDKSSDDEDEEDDSDSDDNDDDEASPAAGAEIDELSYRPNPAAFARQGADPATSTTSREKSKQDGVYRPPRIAATLMPTTETKEKKNRDRPMRSTTMDEYINTELSSAPIAEPSVGSNIAAGGRRSKDARQLAKEQERRDYEEANLVRLPKESKKGLGKDRARDRGGFGGEEWRDLGNSLNRIADVTKRRGPKESALDKSRKRRAVEDGPRDSGIGDAFDLKRRRTMKKMGRK